MAEKGKKRCAVCGKASPYVADVLGVCASCIRERPKESLSMIERAHAFSREQLGLPVKPPNAVGGVECGRCSNSCSVGVGERGYCGLWRNDRGIKSIPSEEDGLLYAYLDPHVTNCCSAWFCPGGTGAGYPRFAHRDGPEVGYSNLSVFLYVCNFDCLFCQNPSHKRIDEGEVVSARRLVDRIVEDPKISCVCFFGGSPEPQLPFTIETAELAIEESASRPMRICYEWNGCGNLALVRRAAELSLVSGGNVKFDLKCFTPELSLALNGVRNERAYRNFEIVAKELYPQRQGLPMLTATTLLVPSYVDVVEVQAIAEFIASLDPSIPYSLLVFHPAHLMRDLPVTPLQQVVECFRASRRHLENVNVGNLGLLGIGGMPQLLSMAGD